MVSQEAAQVLESAGEGPLGESEDVILVQRIALHECYTDYTDTVYIMHTVYVYICINT